MSDLNCPASGKVFKHPNGDEVIECTYLVPGPAVQILNRTWAKYCSIKPDSACYLRSEIPDARV